MNRRLLFGVIAVVVLVGLVLLLRANLPVLLAVTPGDGETHIPVGSPITLTFSEEMQPESVEGGLEIQPAVTGDFSWDGSTLTFTPAEPWPSSERISVTLRAGARSSLGLPLLGERSWSFSISPPLLVYLWPADGPADLYAIDLVDNLAVRLTEQPNGILAYDISADGAYIYFSARLDARNSAIFRLERLSATVTQILLCSNVLCSSPEISPAGDGLTYTRAPSNPESEPFPQQVWLLPVVDGEPQPASQASLVSDPDHPVGAPLWSPTGLLTYHDKTLMGFVVFDPASAERQGFPNETGEPGTWAPDGSNFIVHEVEFWGPGQLDFSSHLWRFEYPAARSTNLSLDRSLEDVTPAYAPDGTRIAFGRRYLDPDRFAIGSQLWLMAPDGGDQRQITNSPDYNHADFAWHPDGDLLAFVRHKQTDLIEPPEIWIIQPDGSDAARLVIGGYAPQWVP